MTTFDNRSIGWLFENVYRPAHRGHQARTMLAATAEAVELLQTFQGADPLASDVTPELLRGFVQFLKLQGDTEPRAYRRRRRILAIVDHVRPPVADPCAGPPEAGTLRRSLETRFESLSGKSLDDSAGRYRSAIAHFVRFCGRDVLLADVTPESVDEWEETLARPWAPKLAGALRTVLRVHDPVRFRKRSPRQTADESPTDDSRWLLWNTYRDYEASRLRTRRENTRRLYRFTLLAFERHLGRRATLDDLADDALTSFATDRGTRVVKSTVNRDLSNLMALRRWCADRGIVDTRPAVELEKIPRRVPLAWKERELRQLMTAIDKLPGSVGLFAARDWWAALVLWCDPTPCWAARRPAAADRCQPKCRLWQRATPETAKNGPCSGPTVIILAPHLTDVTYFVTIRERGSQDGKQGYPVC